jgi:hypothetical protein
MIVWTNNFMVIIVHYFAPGALCRDDFRGLEPQAGVRGELT